MAGPDGGSVEFPVDEVAAALPQVVLVRDAGGVVSPQGLGGSNLVLAGTTPPAQPIVRRPPGSSTLLAPSEARLPSNHGKLWVFDRGLALMTPSPTRPYRTPRSEEKGSPRRRSPKVDAGGFPRFHEGSASCGQELRPWTRVRAADVISSLSRPSEAQSSEHDRCGRHRRTGRCGSQGP